MIVIERDGECYYDLQHVGNYYALPEGNNDRA